MQLIEKLMSKKKTCQFIHPAYRALILKKQRLCRRSKRKIPAAQKLVDRAIHYYSPTPCIIPFLCQNCGMSSCDLEIIRHHNCGKKIGGLSEYSNWKRIVSHGYRSKAKDALAILETIPYPQLAKIKQHKSKNHEEAVDGPIEPTFNPKSLADYAYVALDKIHFSQPPDKFIANGPHRLLKRDMLIDKDDGCAPRRLGYYCFGCQKIYRPYFAFDEHLDEDNSLCAIEPLEVDITSNFPLNGSIVAPTIIPSVKISSFSCTQCHQSDFKNREQFHEHLFECARNPNFDDEYPTPTPTLSEASSF
uniref:C2H2-type domain-containing protein n=1 Tax=Panagrolaimus superbus TaxID=310955 RepID=A0A914Z724_9BILA